MNPKEVIITSYQLAIFPNNFIESDLSNFFTGLVRDLRQFDGDSKFYPIPLDIPKDVPRILLQAKDESLRCEISFSKVSLFWQNTEDNPDWNIESGNIITLSKGVITRILGDRDFARIGVVVNLFYPSEDRSKIIRDKVLRSEVVSDELSDYSIRLVYKKTRGDLLLNYVVNLSTALRSDPDGSERVHGVNIQCDLNTEAEKNIHWDWSKVNSYLNEVFTEGVFDKDSILKSANLSENA